MNKSLDALDRLKQACVFIRGPDGTGSGYFVAPGRIGTALHVVRSWREGQHFPVIVGVGGPVCEAYLLKSDPSTDSALLGFDEKIDAVPLPVAAGIASDCAWQGYGFPALANKTEKPHGLPIDGLVSDPRTINDIGQPSILLFSHQVAAGNASPLHGFSGGPVVVDGALIGHLTKHLGDADDKRRAAYGYVYACPIDALVSLMDAEPQRVEVAPEKIVTRAESIPPIGDDEYHVFISYRSTDRPWAMSLVTRLEGAGLKVFIDQRELQPGGYLAQQLESALERSRAAVVLVSKGWLASQWCQQEANVLEKRAVEDPSFKLIPLRIDDIKMPALLDSRVWLDFNGTKEAKGPELDSLLSALIGKRADERSATAIRADEAEVLTTDKFVAEIRTAARSDIVRVRLILDDWRKTGSTDVAPLIAAAEIYCGTGQFESALDLLDGMPQTLRVRQLHAFALGKMGRVDEAIKMLEALSREGELDPETSGLLAGTYKTRWRVTSDKAYLRRAYAVYREAFERTGDVYNGINAAAMALQCGEHDRMLQFAMQVRDKLLKVEESRMSHWDLASVGEVNLLLRRFDDARDWYGKATASAAGLFQDIAVMRRQARLNLKALGEPENKLDDILPVPRVLVYVGHMVDAPDRPSPRFPASIVGHVRKAIRERIERYGMLCGYGQAARGTDLIVLQELLKHRLPARVVLPFPAADYVPLSVGAGDWKKTFDAVIADECVSVLEPLMPRRPPDAELAQGLAEANREVKRRAIEFARRLDETPVVLAVWDGREGDGPGGTADAVALWRDEGLDVDVIDINEIRARNSA